MNDILIISKPFVQFKKYGLTSRWGHFFTNSIIVSYYLLITGPSVNPFPLPGLNEISDNKFIKIHPHVRSLKIISLYCINTKKGLSVNCFELTHYTLSFYVSYIRETESTLQINPFD